MDVENGSDDAFVPAWVVPEVSGDPIVEQDVVLKVEQTDVNWEYNYLAGSMKKILKLTLHTMALVPKKEDWNKSNVRLRRPSIPGASTKAVVSAAQQRSKVQQDSKKVVRVGKPARVDAARKDCKHLLK